MESNSDTMNQDGTSKKSIFDDLNRDELINKCKAFLAIAQKAKHAKTELQNEVESYKLQLEKCENEKKVSQENLKTLQELVDSLTEQKLNYITDLDSAQNQIKSYKEKCDRFEQEIKTVNASLLVKEKQTVEVTQKLSDLDSEIISLKRQNNRLVEENEQLINQLTELETRTAEFNNIGLQQREQLRILEQKVQSDEVYHKKIEELLNTIKELETKLQTSNTTSHTEVNEYENKIKEITQKYEVEKLKNDKALIKLRSYKDKILKCAACIHQLKNSRYILTQTVKEYSENIPKWQSDIVKASKVLDDQINSLTRENKILNEKLELLQKEIEDAPSKDISALLQEYQAENESLRSALTKLQQELEESLSSKYSLSNENQTLQQQISHLETQLRSINLNNQEHNNSNAEVQNMQIQVEKQLENNAVIINENRSLKQQLIELEKQLHENINNDNQIQALKSEIIKLQTELQNNISKESALTNDNQSLKLETMNLQKKLEENIARATKLQNDNEVFKNELIILRQQLQDTTIIQAALNNELTIVKDANNSLKDVEIPAYVNEIESLKTEINTLIEKNNNLSIKNTELNSTIKDLHCNFEALKSKNENSDAVENLNLQIKALETEKAILVKEKLNAKDNMIELENQNRILSDQIKKIKSEVHTLNDKLKHLSQEKLSYKESSKKSKEEEINKLKKSMSALQEQYDLLKKEHDNLQDLNGLLKEEVETLKLSLEQPTEDSENLSDLNVSLQADIVKLETKLAAYKQENASLLSEMKESRAKIKEFDNMMTEYEEMKSKVTGYKTENSELLNEMKEINQVLKERGEAISKLQKAVTEMERLIETLEKDRDQIAQEKENLNKKVGTLENELKNAIQNNSNTSEIHSQLTEERDIALRELVEKHNQIAALQEEIEKLKHQQNTADYPNEDMSTSTISKAEENARMKDLDESFEEKYTKLRIYALKLKKKLNETISQLQSTENDKARLEKVIGENEKSQVKILVPASQSPDEVDSANKVGDGDGVKSDRITELESKVKSLTATLEAFEQIAAELGKVKAELHSKTQELSNEIEAHKATKDALEKARRDVKKKNVLSLEMEDYERSLKELTIKMEESKKKIVQMESTIDTQEGTITAMKIQIKLLEEQIKTEETQNRLTKEELQRAIEESKEKDQAIHMKNDIITKLEQDLEDEKRKNEETALEMTSVLSEKEKMIMILGEEKTDLNSKLKRLEFKYAELSESLKITNIELADLKTEYTSYKVRAQAVLRQNQTVDHSQEEQLKEETAALRAQIESLTAKLTIAEDALAKQAAEVEANRRRAAEATGEAARAQQRTARLQADLTRIGQQLDTERAQHKLQVSTLTQCYKTQINELETKLQKETEALKKQLMASQESMKIVKMGSLEANQNPYMLPVIPKEEGSDGEMDINVSMIPREEGEGSESAPSPPLSKPYLTSAGSGRSPVSLERLLEEGVPEDESLDTSSLGLTPDQEIADLRRKLQAQQQRVKHVTVLLSESERECARMAQLAELLKAELRRVRGTASNTHNTEYMKNVTLKFLTLAPGDERSRLVPVLQKILTLTPDETQKIQAIAKGQDPNTKGWGSYLPWPGGK